MKISKTSVVSKTSTRGYVLVSTLLVLFLVVLLVVAMLSMQRRSGNRTAIDRDIVEAKANAMFALDVAIAELQRYAGPDQAVTAPAEILEKPDQSSENVIQNPKWNGVWSATQNARINQSLPAFLVSGNEKFTINETTAEYPAGYMEPTAALDSEKLNVVEMVSKIEPPENGDDSLKSEPVLVVKQALMESQANGSLRKKGSYAFWVGDEGVKAKVNVLDPFRDTTDDEEKRFRFTTSQRPGVEAVLNDFDPGNEKSEVAGTMGEFALVQNPPLEDIGTYLHDLTTYSKGLLTDTRRGGLRRDLTMAFESDKIFEREFAAKKTGITPGSNLRTDDLYTLTTSRLPEFYLIPDILFTALKYDKNLGKWAGGPNWGNLREYYLLYQRPPGQFPFLPHPRCGVKMRHYSFNPYKHGVRDDKRDYYQRNSPVSPVLSRAQMNVRLRTKKIEPKSKDEEPKYQLEWEIQPVIGIWNPYNIPFANRTYRFDWEISVFLELKIEGTTRRYDLYQLWKDKNSPWFSPNATNCDLQPGENRLFTIDSRQNLRRTVNLTPNWTEDGAFWVTLPSDPKNPSSSPLLVEENQLINVERVGLVASVENQKWSPELQELQKHNTFFAMKYDDASDGPNSAVESSSVRMNNLWKADDRFGPVNVPDPGGDSSPFPPFRPSQYTDEPIHLASWLYYLRTSNETDLGHRNFIDSNVRAIVANSRWDGSVEDRGWRALSWLNDGSNRALLPQGNEEPEADGIGRYRGFGGNSIGAAGETHHIIFDIPKEPLLSLGQLQHANIGRYNNEPSFVVGNSYHNIRIPLDQLLIQDFAVHDEKGLYNSHGVDVFDLSYYVNHTLWDSYFFSSISPDTLDDRISDLEKGLPLPNSRYLSHTPAKDLETAFEKAEKDEGKEIYDALGSKFIIDGAFNINSTSVPAWKATLSSLRELEIPVYDPFLDTLSTWEKKGIIFSRFSRPYSKAFNSEESATEDNYWRGYRELTDDQIHNIAVDLVRQIRLRGPFRSLADFVNRSLIDHDPSTDPVDDTRMSGPLQTALDRAEGVNNGAVINDIASPVMEVPNSTNEFSDVPESANQGTGYAGHLLQGDILQALGPILTARSDTFRIRAYGDKIITPKNAPEQETLKARAWCEAIVQRIPDPVEPIDESFSHDRNITQSYGDIKTSYHDVDRPYFGRKFRIVSFRWLEKGEL